MSEIRDIIEENLEELQGLLQEDDEYLAIWARRIHLVRWGRVVGHRARAVADCLEGRVDVGQSPDVRGKE